MDRIRYSERMGNCTANGEVALDQHETAQLFDRLVVAAVQGLCASGEWRRMTKEAAEARAGAAAANFAEDRLAAVAVGIAEAALANRALEHSCAEPPTEPASIVDAVFQRIDASERNYE